MSYHCKICDQVIEDSVLRASYYGDDTEGHKEWCPKNPMNRKPRAQETTAPQIQMFAEIIERLKRIESWIARHEDTGE